MKYEHPDLFEETIKLLNDGNAWCQNDYQSKRYADWNELNLDYDNIIDVYCTMGAMAQVLYTKGIDVIGQISLDARIAPYIKILADIITEEYPELNLERIALNDDHTQDYSLVYHDRVAAFNDISNFTFEEHIKPMLEKSHARLQELV